MTGTRQRIQGKTRMATGPFKAPMYLMIGGPAEGTLWVPQNLVVVSADDSTMPAGAPFYTLSIGQGDPTVPGNVIVTAILLPGGRPVPGSFNFAALNSDMKMHSGDLMWLRIGGAPAPGTVFTAALQYQEILPAGAEELNTL